MPPGVIGAVNSLREGHGAEFFDWITRDKGTGRRLTDFGPLTNPPGFQRLADFPNLTTAMVDRGWSADRVAGVMGGNWRRFLEQVWGG